MDFGKQIKQIRADRKMTQEQMANELHVSRQAVSNWENNKNLPDLELIIQIAQVFHLSLDELILVGEYMNNMKKKMIREGSETRRAKINLIVAAIGALLLFLGAGCILIKAASVEYVDAAGILHENFFLLPIGFLFIACGLLTFVIAGIKKIVDTFKNKK